MHDDFTNLRAALPRFDRYHKRWHREFERLLESLPKCQADDPKDPQWEKNNAAVLQAFENCNQYRIRVMAPAFYADTSDRNSMQTCEMVFASRSTDGYTDVSQWIRDLASLRAAS